MGSDSIKHVQGNYTILSLRKRLRYVLVIYHTNCICKACWVVFFQNGRLILIVSEPIRYNLVCMLKDYIRNTDLDLWRYIVE